MNLLNIFEITIQHRQGANWPVVAEHSRSGQLPQRSEGELTLKQKFVEDLLQLRLHVHGYGSYLGEVLFQGTILIKFMQARAQAETDEEPLRILLVVEAPDLKPLRWERLCAPDSSGDWNFLALDQRNPFSLYLPSLTDRRFSAIGRRDLRALVLLADPPKDNRYKLDSFDAQATADSIGKALGDIPFDLLGPVKKAVGPASIDALCAQITAEQYTFFHLVAHGLYRNDGETTIYLLDEAHQVAPLSASDLIKRQKNLGGVRGLPHLAFLCTCESAKPEAEAALGGLAQQLVRDLGLPAVVAMTDPVSIATAEILSTSFYRQLRKHGQPDQALTEACAGMQGRADILVPALYSRLGGKPLFSDELNGRTLTDPEIEYGLERLACQLPARAPVQLHPFLAHAHTLWNTLGTKRKELSSVASKEHDNALSACNNLCDVVLERSFSAVALGQPIPEYKSICPFPGLKAFQTEEQEFFFGRDMKTEELTARLQDERFLAVLGASGSGKSSLVLAGLIPALKKQAEQKGSSLQVRYLTPGSEPEKTLARQLEIPSSDEQPVLPSLPSLLVVDQFEELFTLCADPVARKHFLDRLLAAWNKQPDLHVILTMRADFWGDCAPYLELKELMQAHQELLAPMTAAELRTAMEEQASSVGLRFEGGLSHTILSQVEGEPGAMPLLQHLLLELWKRRHGRWLMASEYEELGGIKEAIGRTAEVIYDQFKGDKKGQGLLRTLFVRLTRLDEGSTKKDEIAANKTPRSDNLDKDPYSRDTRQRVNLKELLSLDTDKERVRNLVKLLADARLLVTTTDKDSAGKNVTEVEVAHEALIRHWPRLRNWLNEDRESWMLLASVGQQAQDWEKGGKKAGDLPRWGERLREAAVLFGLKKFSQTKQEEEFLRKAKRLAKKEQVMRVGAVIFVIMLLAGGIVLQTRNAEKQKILTITAEKNEKTAKEKTEQVEIVLNNLKKEEKKTKDALKDSKLNLAKAFRQRALTAIQHKGNLAPYQEAILSVASSFALEDREDPGLILSLLADDVFQTSLAKQWTYNAIKEIYHPENKAMYGSVVGSLRPQATFSASFDPNEERIAASVGNSVFFLDITTGTLLNMLNKQDNRRTVINSIAFSPDGKKLASASNDKTIQLWNLETGKPTKTLNKHKESVNSVAFSPDGKQLISGSVDDTVRLWDTESGTQLKVFKGPEDDINKIYGLGNRGIRSVSFSPDGKRLAFTSWDAGTVHVLDVEKWISLKILKGDQDETRVNAVVFSQLNGRWLASSHEANIRIWDTENYELHKVLNAPSLITSLSFSPDGKRIASSTVGGSVQIWDTENGNVLRDFLVHWDKKTRYFKPDSVSFSSDGKWLASSGKGEIQLWDAAPQKRGAYRKLDHIPGEIKMASFTPDEKRIVFATNSTVWLWDTRTEKLTSIKPEDLDLHERLRHYAFSPDKRYLATLYQKGDKIQLRDATTGDVQTKLKSTTSSSFKTFSFSPNSKLLASASYDNKIKIWSVENGTKQNNIFKVDEAEVDGYIWAFSFNADNSKLTVLTTLRKKGDEEDAIIWSWNIETGIKTVIGRYENIQCLLFSPDGRKFAFSLDNNIIHLCDIDGKELAALRGHKENVHTLSFHPDGTKLASASFDGTVRVWDIKAGKRPIIVSGAGVRHLSFSSDNKLLGSGAIRHWSTTDRSGENQWFLCSNARSQLRRTNQRLTVWDIKAGKELVELDNEGTTDALFSPDGKWIVSIDVWGGNSVVRIRDVKSHSLFLNSSKPSPLYHLFIEAVKFLWQINVQGYEIVHKERTPADLERFGALLAPPPSGQTKFDQVLQWAESQQQAGK